jgi:hypothetical protein
MPLASDDLMSSGYDRRSELFRNFRFFDGVAEGGSFEIRIARLVQSLAVYP